jgi:hypothetical protein
MKKATSDKIFVILRSVLKLLMVHSFIVLYVIVGGGDCNRLIY